ncbi:helix-turn-helix domain-containing protein [Herbaspirillum sp. RV1423]|uniref:helix-turn-helix domain-containing protein n=1 Tax=Herbaspirillum sp. RV1423 TaxID=1443993 RepID=UPI00054EE8DD|nr:helix-turn-helix domain-containing protein [Herbaspirillum sp. RV1423]
MKKIASVTERIHQLLREHGVAEREHIKTVAQIIGLQYISTQQKFSGRKSWTTEQLTRICHYFDEPLTALIEHDPSISAHRAVLLGKGAPQRCLVRLGKTLAKPALENLAITKNDDEWYVLPGKDVPEGKLSYAVLNMEVLPPPCVALLDDEEDSMLALASIFEDHGIETRLFQKPTEILAASQKQVFDAYLLDWVLGAGKTAEEVVSKIRELSKELLIVILTGEIRTGVVKDSELAYMMRAYDVTVCEKPALSEILVTIFFKRLFFS